MTDPRLYYLPDGRHVCTICCEAKEHDELMPVSDEPGKVWDVCKVRCAQRGIVVICIAGVDKPHRCVKCWAASDLPTWRRPFPRRCRNGHWTLTTYPRRWQGSTFFDRPDLLG